MIARDLALRVQRVAVAAERADHQPAAGHRVAKGLELPLAGQELRRFAMRVARVGARANLYRLHAELDEIVERFLERLVAEEHCEDANLHAITCCRCLVSACCLSS